MLAPLAFVLFFSFRMQSMSASGAQGMLWAFCAVMGLSMASIFLVFTGTSIARTFFIAAAMFGATGLYGYTTKRDLSKFGSFLIMGLIGVVIASLRTLTRLKCLSAKSKPFFESSLSGPFVVCASGSARSCQPRAAAVSQLLQACRLCIHMIGICSNLAGTPLLAH